MRAKDREVEVAGEHAEIEIKQNTQQMKHLKYEAQTKVGELRAETMVQMRAAEESHALQELELLNDKRELRRQLHEAQEMADLQMEQLKMKHSELLWLVPSCFKVQRFYYKVLLTYVYISLLLLTILLTSFYFFLLLLTSSHFFFRLHPFLLLAKNVPDTCAKRMK